MSNKKGFVLIETIVTIVVLAASLLYIYSSFNNVLITEKTRVRYDDIGHIYHSYYVKEFFMQYSLNSVIRSLNTNNPIIIVGCDYSGIFNSADDEVAANATCNQLVNTLGITKIAVALGDLSYIQDCSKDDTSSKCSYLYNFSDEEQSYLETLGNLGEENKYVMVIEYSEEKILGETLDFSKIHNNYNYAWVKI